LRGTQNEQFVAFEIEADERRVAADDVVCLAVAGFEIVNGNFAALIYACNCSSLTRRTSPDIRCKVKSPRIISCSGEKIFADFALATIAGGAHSCALAIEQKTSSEQNDRKTIFLNIFTPFNI